MFIYFVKAGDAVKVGVANNVGFRITGIQVGNPYKVELLHQVQLNEEEAWSMEAEIHRLFHKTNVQGEWFQATQFLYDYIENIKNNGIDTRKSWISENYINRYSSIIKKLKQNIERDIMYGNLVSLDILRKELSSALDMVFGVSSAHTNLAEAVREWVENRETPFSIREIYHHFGLTEHKARKNVNMILLRLSKEGLIERTRKGVYIKKRG